MCELCDYNRNRLLRSKSRYFFTVTSSFVVASQQKNRRLDRVFALLASELDGLGGKVSQIIERYARLKSSYGRLEDAVGPIRAEIANVLKAVQLGSDEKEKLENLSQSLGLTDDYNKNDDQSESQQGGSELHLHPMPARSDVVDEDENHQQSQLDSSNFLSRQVVSLVTFP